MSTTPKLAVLIVATLLCSCASPYDAWQTAPVDRHCTLEQAKQVDFETRTCSAAGGNFGNYCFGSALVRNCSLHVADTQPVKEPKHESP